MESCVESPVRSRELKGISTNSLLVCFVNALRKYHDAMSGGSGLRVRGPWCRVAYMSLLTARYDEQSLRAPSRSVECTLHSVGLTTQSLLVAVKATRECRNPRYTTFERDHDA